MSGFYHKCLKKSVQWSILTHMNTGNHDPRTSSMKESIKGKGTLRTKDWVRYTLTIFPKHTAVCSRGLDRKEVNSEWQAMVRLYIFC